jgi:hypothetical protein
MLPSLGEDTEKMKSSYTAGSNGKVSPLPWQWLYFLNCTLHFIIILWSFLLDWKHMMTGFRSLFIFNVYLLLLPLHFSSFYIWNKIIMPGFFNKVQMK